ncbi:hypothetical protein PVAG01_08287 [Phlyctema vagabunda]|uniref:Uncharacterized protein n=1 Tax=Phlyctema vagabunda TaxID=108571 RepID=A0ABR4P915_9HELO
MSGSPPLPSRRNPEASGRGHGGYGPGQDVFRGALTPQSDQADPNRRQHLRPYHPEQHLVGASYASPQVEDTAMHYQYQQGLRQPIPQQQPPQQQYYSAHQTPSQPPIQYQLQNRQPITEAADQHSPKPQRKTKGHVASACVPCKKAHLR